MIGIFLGLVFLLYFIYRRIRVIISRLSKDQLKRRKAAPGFIASLRNLLMIFLWTAVFGMVFFMGFFFQAYHSFTMEEPIAEILIESHPRSNKSIVSLVQYRPSGDQETSFFEISGDQWMLEGDIMKWSNWINFLGLHSRYRLTRLRGRYIKTEDEISESETIYPLVVHENHPVWGYLYKHGAKLPFVSTVYGNSVFQSTKKSGSFLVYVGTSGFIVRKSDR